MLQVICTILVLTALSPAPMLMGERETPTLDAAVAAVKLCSQDGIHSIRVHVSLIAKNVGPVTAVIPRIMDVDAIRIIDLENGRSRTFDIGYRPRLSKESLGKLEAEGGGVAVIATGQQINVLGLYLPFVVAAGESPQSRHKPMQLQLGRAYRIQATLRVWSDTQLERWTRLGYLTRREATVVASFDLPPNPTWDACPDEPPIVIRRPKGKRAIEP